ncbi:MAG: RNA methyltransferase [Bacteroidaceae bacterium]|nr:RNA methyltransferase [Bacteroidaceae bacterium]
MRKLNVLELNRISLDEYKNSKKIPLVVVLDDIRSMYNVGSVFRTSDAFRVEAIYLCGITSRPPHPEIHKTALGAEDSVDWQYFHNPNDAISLLKQKDYYIFGVEQVEHSIMLNNLPSLLPPLNYKGVAIILGNEVKGVNQALIDQCHECIEIPQFGTKHSLNISTAAGIVIWDLWQRIKN